MRKLASVRKISDLLPIEGADQIELALVDGWQVVVKKGDFRVGDLVIYFEIDSWIPYQLAPFLCKGREPRVYNGVEGERLRTVKLRGQISQGLLLYVPDYDSVKEGDDLTEELGIQLYEKPVPAQLAGLTRGYFPSFIPKTDEERVQNLTNKLENWKDHEWEVTEKLDGSSMTVYWKDGNFGVCSRNLDLKEGDTTFWKVAKENSLHEFSSAELGNIAIQGELIGEGIQGNKYQIKGHQFRVFNVFDIDKQQYLGKIERDRICNGLGLMQAPLLDIAFVPDVKVLLEKADGISKVAKMATKREGLVFKSQTDTSIHFKAISNSWLLKNE